MLDGIETSRKWGDEATVTALAIAAMVLHAAAAANGWRARAQRRPRSHDRRLPRPRA